MIIVNFSDSAKYRIDENSKTWQFFKILIIFKILEILQFFRFEKLANFQIRKLPEWINKYSRLINWKTLNNFQNVTIVCSFDNFSKIENFRNASIFPVLKIIQVSNSKISSINLKNPIGQF